MGTSAPSSFRQLLLTQRRAACDDEWTGSSFEWLKRAAPRSKGAFGERLVADAAAAAGAVVTRPASSDADVVVGGVGVEVKLSTLWADGSLRFQQLRDQDYDVVVFVSVTPEVVLVHGSSKAEALAHATGQHTGAAAAETSWVCWDAGDTPAWLTPLDSPDDLVKFILAST